ncbi:MAG: deoxyribodipyrimidine photo-lyase [Phycisphaerales bacterium JB043]
MRSLVWFRSDLRVRDNPALHEAARVSDHGVVGLFVVCPRQWQQHDWAPIRVDFVLRNLREFSSDLEGLNIALRVIETPDFTDVPEAILGVAQEHGCDRLLFNEEYEVHERRRDEDVTDLLKRHAIGVDTFCDQCVIEPATLLTGKREFYKVFTPFKRAWLTKYGSNVSTRAPLDAVPAQDALVGRPDEVPARVPGFECGNAREDLWPAGERAAHERLTGFLQTRLHAYKRDRDVPALDATSTLSPYLTSGVLSTRQCVHVAVEESGGQLDSMAEGCECWVTELIWREFYRHILVGFPRVSMHRAFNPDTERIRWNECDDHFEAWREGRTGYPIVDAGMRQLRETGWMHNRLRMILAMFLSKNLFLDWRRGERFFMRNLIDGDLASNNGGWQWSASTGCDAAPYFRIFNPYTQSRRFDPNGEFIRRHVHELRDVEGDDVHDPEMMPELPRSQLDYPRPIVDHSTTRAHAIEVFKQLRRA